MSMGNLAYTANFRQHTQRQTMFNWVELIPLKNGKPLNNTKSINHATRLYSEIWKHIGRQWWLGD
jgi:hypothetical protein